MPPPFDIISRLIPGAVVTIKVTLVAAVLALVVALLMGMARSSKNRAVRALSGFYVELFRGTSALVQLFWIYFVLPLPPFKIFLTPFQAGVLTLGLNLGAYGSEVVRGAIRAVPPGQIEAAIALNFTPAQRMRRVVLPQAMVRIIPPFGNLLIELLKATALVSLISLSDLTFEGLKLQQTVGRTTEIFTILLISYFVIAYPLSRSIRWFENRREWS
jgi:polar amino acid transport system permease protein